MVSWRNFWHQDLLFSPSRCDKTGYSAKKMIQYIKLMILVMNKIKSKLMKYLTRQIFQVIKEYLTVFFNISVIIHLIWMFHIIPHKAKWHLWNDFFIHRILHPCLDDQCEALTGLITVVHTYFTQVNFNC